MSATPVPKPFERPPFHPFVTLARELSQIQGAGRCAGGVSAGQTPGVLGPWRGLRLPGYTSNEGGGSGAAPTLKWPTFRVLLSQRG